jgi:hypothetical protein
LPPAPAKRILQHIVDILDARKLALKPRSQHPEVRLQFHRKPSGGF